MAGTDTGVACSAKPCNFMTARVDLWAAFMKALVRSYVSELSGKSYRLLIAPSWFSGVGSVIL